jgi:hypothetical protein
VGVVDHQDDRTLFLEASQQVEDLGSRRDMVPEPGCLPLFCRQPGRFGQPGVAHQLLDDPVGQIRFGLVPAGAEDLHVRACAHKPVHQRALADSRRAFDQDDVGVSRSCFVELGAQ